MVAIVTSRTRRNLEPRWPFAIDWSSAYTRGLVGAFAFWDQQGRFLEHVKHTPLTYNGTIVYVDEFGGSTYTVAGLSNYIDVGRALLVAEDNFTLFSDAWFSTVNTDRQGFYFGQYNRNGGYDLGLYIGGTNDNPQFYGSPTGPAAVTGAANSLDTVRRQYHSGVYRRNTPSLGVQGRIWSDIDSVGLSSYGNASAPDVASTSNHNFLVAGGFSAVAYVPTSAHKGGLVWNRAVPEQELDILHAPDWPWRIFQEYGRRVYILPAEAAAGRTVNATSAAIALTSHAATVNAARAVDAGSAAITLAAFAATIGGNLSIDATSAGITITANAATVTPERAVSASVAAVTFSANAATITTTRGVTAAAAAVVLTAQQATVTTAAPVLPPAVTFSGHDQVHTVTLPRFDNWQQLHYALNQGFTSLWRHVYETEERTTKITTSSTVSHGMVLADASASAVTVKLLPVREWANRMIRIKKTDSSVNLVLIVPQSGETIDGGSTTTISTQYSVVSLYSDGNEWHKL